MVEPRRSSARIKAEPALKRKFSDALDDKTTPPRPVKSVKAAGKAAAKNAAAKPAPSPTPPVEEPAKPILPTKLTDSIPLPVLPEPQEHGLKESEWQSITESGVFAASLARARQAIVRGTYFEKFWTKPTTSKKQKDMTEEEKLQLKAAKGPTQSKVGQVRLISEPLTFDVTLYMVRDPNPSQKLGQLPLDKQHLIYGSSPHRVMTPQNNPYRPPQQHQPHFVAPTPPRPPAPITPSPNTTPVPAPGSAPVPAPVTPTPRPAPPPPKSTSAPRNGAANPQAPDPVIHALAQRASANPELKAIMKIVATGRASQPQLTYFQRHIDELTEMVKQRQEQEARARGPTVPLPAPARQVQSVPTPPQVARQPAQQQPRPQVQPPQVPRPPPQVSRPPPATPHPVAPSVNTTPTPQPPRPAPTYYQPVPSAPRPKMVTTAPPLHVILAFSENNNERFLFPKYSILEFQDNLTTLIASFVVLKKKIDKELWTPVTITIKGDAPTLSVIGRVVEPVDVVKRYMEDVMVQHERAEDEYLAFRLPRDGIIIEEL